MKRNIYFFSAYGCLRKMGIRIYRGNASRSEFDHKGEVGGRPSRLTGLLYARGPAPHPSPATAKLSGARARGRLSWLKALPTARGRSRTLAPPGGPGAGGAGLRGPHRRCQREARGRSPQTDGPPATIMHLSWQQTALYYSQSDFPFISTFKNFSRNSLTLKGGKHYARRSSRGG